jgi:hypothetical protein
VRVRRIGGGNVLYVVKPRVLAALPQCSIDPEPMLNATSKLSGKTPQLAKREYRVCRDLLDARCGPPKRHVEQIESRRPRNARSGEHPGKGLSWILAVTQVTFSPGQPLGLVYDREQLVQFEVLRFREFPIEADGGQQS